MLKKTWKLLSISHSCNTAFSKRSSVQKFFQMLLSYKKIYIIRLLRIEGMFGIWIKNFPGIRFVLYLQLKDINILRNCQLLMNVIIIQVLKNALQKIQRNWGIEIQSFYEKKNQFLENNEVTTHAKYKWEKLILKSLFLGNSWNDF